MSNVKERPAGDWEIVYRRIDTMASNKNTAHQPKAEV